MSGITKTATARLSHVLGLDVRTLTITVRMRRISLVSAVGAACAVSLTACAHFRHTSGIPFFSVKPAASRPPRTVDIASQYGCTQEQLATNSQRAHLVLARPGTPICSVLGRYGDPVSVSKSSIADMQLVSMLHREPNGHYINATFVYYEDTKVNRQLKRPIGKWIVDRVTTTR